MKKNPLKSKVKPPKGKKDNMEKKPMDSIKRRTTADGYMPR